MQLSAEHGAWAFSAGKKVLGWDVGFGFRPNDVVQQEARRSLLHHVTRDANLLHVALDTGYPDATHFSHSIRQVYGLRPRDLFAGSRRLTVLG